MCLFPESLPPSVLFWFESLPAVSLRDVGALQVVTDDQPMGLSRLGDGDMAPRLGATLPGP